MTQSKKFLVLPPFYIVGNIAWAKTVLQGEPDIVGPSTVESTIPAMVRLVGSHSIATAREPRHKYLRNLIIPDLSPKVVEALVPRAVDIITSYLATWADSATPVKAAEELRSLTFDFIIKSFMGCDFDTTKLQAIKCLYKTWSQGLLAFPFLDFGHFNAFGRAVIAHRKMIQIFQAEIDTVRQLHEQGLKVEGMLGSMVAAGDDAGNRLTDDEIKDNLLVFVLAGHDTTSTTLTSVLAMLQDHPAVWVQLRSEQEQLVADHGAAITAAVLKHMTYAEAVIRETLRLPPVVTSVNRVAACDFELGGYRVPKGMNLMIPISWLHLTDPRWSKEQPSAFKPERMLQQEPDGQTKPVANGQMMPFGHGPRLCAGSWVAMVEMRVFLAVLARGYDFTADTNTTWKNKLGPYPKNGLPVTFRRRSTAALLNMA